MAAREQDPAAFTPLSTSSSSRRRGGTKTYVEALAFSLRLLIPREKSFLGPPYGCLRLERLVDEFERLCEPGA